MTASVLSKSACYKRAALAITASLTIISFAAAPAIAQKRAPAPIVFAGQGGGHTAPAPRTQTTKVKPRKLSRKERRRAKRAAKEVASQQAAPSRRVEFRYPDQPEVFYGEDGARADADAAPLSFSSSTSAITQEEASKFSYGNAPVIPVAAPAVQKDPAITPGGFDARAVAARTAQKAQPSFVSAAGPADFSSAPLYDEPKPTVQTASYVEPKAPDTRPVSGTPFTPEQNAVYDKTGQASVFHPVLNGQPTSTGEILDTHAMVAAHPSLPLPSLVQVINLDNNREVVVRVNDRGPIDGNGLIEVSERAANVLGFDKTGLANVRVRYLGEAPALSPTAQPASAAPAQIQPVAKKAPLFAKAPKPAPFASPVQYADNGEQFMVQFASFTDISNAQRMYASLGTSVGNLGIVPAQVNGTDYFRVVAGPLSNRKAAEQLRDKLANQGVGRGLVIAAP